MNDKNSDLEYVSNALRKAEKNGASNPFIWCLWGVIVLLGYAVIEFVPLYATTYWIILCPVGGLLSWWLGEKGIKSRGQADSELGMKFVWHFLVMLIFVFTAMFTRQYVEILLLVGMGYALAGLYLDRVLLGVGAVALLVYIAVHLKLISSPLFVGVVLALGFFASAWVTSRANRSARNPA